eukprot:6819249-Prorocentrum_lima.AAC.1
MWREGRRPRRCAGGGRVEEARVARTGAHRGIRGDLFDPKPHPFDPHLYATHLLSQFHAVPAA